MTTQTTDTLDTEIKIVSSSTDSTNATILEEQEETTTLIEEGFEGIPRLHNNIYNNSLLIFLTFSFFIIFVAISRRKISFKTIISNKEESKEEVRRTIIDIVTTLSLCAITIITYAITLIYLTPEASVQPTLTLKNISMIGGAIAATIALQQATLWIIGKLFFERNKAKQFLKDNIRYYTIPAIILTPTITSYILSFCSSNTLIYIALSLTLLTRLTFVIRNIKNFKHNIGTTCYNILYLCTAEITPIAIIYKWALNY